MVVVAVALAVVFIISYHPVGHLAIISSIFIVFAAVALVVVVAVVPAVVVVALAVVAVALVVVVVSLGMILYLQIIRFQCFIEKALWMDGRMDLRTDPLIEMRGHI